MVGDKYACLRCAAIFEARQPEIFCIDCKIVLSRVKKPETKPRRKRTTPKRSNG